MRALLSLFVCPARRVELRKSGSAKPAAAVAVTLVLAIFGCLASTLRAATTAVSDDWRTLLATGQLVDIKTVDPHIQTEMRYATSDNLLGHPMYEPDMPCMVRPEVAQMLWGVQTILHSRGYGLKIWDAYRPAAAQRAIWQRYSARHYVADPGDGRGSLHTWGLAVDVTLVDADGHEVLMPSEFDNFTTAASGIYHGSDPVVRSNLHNLQSAMKTAGFIGLSTEWWHFAARNWHTYEPLHWQSIPPSKQP